jgi:uncharacterized protein
MSATFPSSKTDEVFRPIGADGLPLFRRDCAEYATFYAPGVLCVVPLQDAGRFEAAIPPSGDTTWQPDQEMDWRSELWQRAKRAVAEATAQQQESFNPECLTLYLNNECNLRCVYCYADPLPEPAANLELEAISAAAEVVAANCRQKGLPFYVVFHGGGEPTLHGAQAASVLSLLEAVASAYDVELFRYVATNGVMPETKARWLAHSFDLVGLSCDGPADIHDSQRPRWDGTGSLQVLQRTAHILREEGCPIHVRATITATILHRQAEVAEYLCQQFAPEEIHFEPVYCGGRAGLETGLDTDLADRFVHYLLEASRVAQSYGVSLLSSGSRPGSIHGSYCNVFRQVLNLVPGGAATACFKTSDARTAGEKGAVIGRVDSRTGRFEIDYGRLQALRKQLGISPPRCASCFNRYHCAGDCPDRCSLDQSAVPLEAQEPGFRCRAQAALVAAILEETAERLWDEVLADGGRRPHGAAIL